MVVTRELRDVVKMGLRDFHYSIGPFVTLVDGHSFAFQWEERPKLLLGHIQDADRVAISRTDIIDSKQVEHIRGILNDADNNFLLVSMHNSSFISELVEDLLMMTQED